MDSTDCVLACCFEVSFERVDVLLNALHQWSEFFSEIGQAISCRCAHDKVAPESLLEFCEAPVNGRLTDGQRFCGGDRAAAAGHGQEVPEVIPPEHRYPFLTATCAITLLPRRQLYT